MILSYADMESIAWQLLFDFSQTCKAYSPFIWDRCVPIELFAEDFLNLHIRYEHLFPDPNLCGLTAYKDTDVIIRDRTYHVSANDILVNVPDPYIPKYEINEREITYRRNRFTIAHECAHQIIFGMEHDDAKEKYRRMYENGREYSLRELKTKEDWNEWQANALGAAILMPGKSIAACMDKFKPYDYVISFMGRFNSRDRRTIGVLSGKFDVSFTAMVIRLRQLGFLIYRPRSEFFEPLDIWKCDD